MAYAVSENEERRSRFLHLAQAHNIDTSRVFVPPPIQTRFLPMNIEMQLRQNGFHQRLQQYIAENGTKTYNESIKTMMEAEQQEPLLIAVTGETGVGKSTVINTMRGLSRNDQGAAKTSSNKECTMDTVGYPDSRNPKLLVYYDLPGIGSPNFPREEYAAKVLLDRYDFFIILSSNRFKQDDLYLAKEIKRLGKKFYFVRTRIDESLNNEREQSDENPFDEQAYVNEVRTTSENSLIELIGDYPVFVISGTLKNYNKWDFPKLIQALMNDAPDLKKDIIIRTITANSREVINQKVAVLEQRIFLIATGAAAVGALPIPFLPFACNLSIVTREIHNYMKDFGLDEDSLENLAKKHNMARVEFERKIFGASDLIRSNDASVISEVVQNILKKTAAANMAGECARITPLIGQVVPSATSFVTITYALDTLLFEISELAIKLVDELVKLGE